MTHSLGNHEMPREVKWLSVAMAFVLGAGYSFGPDSTSSAAIFVYTKAMMPIQMWGICFMVCGFVLSATRFWGYAVCGAVWGTWEILLILGATDGRLQSWGAVIWPIYFVTLNFMHIFRWGLARRALVRRENITGYWAARHRSRQEDR